MRANRRPVRALLLLVSLVCVGWSAGQAQPRQERGTRESQGQASLPAKPQATTGTVQTPREVVPALPVLRLVKFSGVAKDELGKPRTGMVGITFAIYKEQEGGAALWLETQNVELDEQGRYTVLLGATKKEGLPLELFSAGEPRWLGAQVNLPRELEQPRVLLVSVPYALKAADAQTLGGKPLSSFLLAPAEPERGAPKAPKAPSAGNASSSTERLNAQSQGPSGSPRVISSSSGQYSTVALEPVSPPPPGMTPKVSGSGTGLSIIPTFNSTGATSIDAATQTVINNAIAFYQSTFTNNITVNIEFHNMSSGLGRSTFFIFNNISYSTYCTALAASATSPDDITAVANTPCGSTNPINGNMNIGVKSPNGMVLGLNTPELPFGSACPTSNFTGSGCIGLNVTLANMHPGLLFAAVEHEIDEVLGLGSALNATTTPAVPWTEDLFRWASAGTRSYAANSTVGNPCGMGTPPAFFSIDGGATNLDDFNNCNNGGDYGDWITHTPSQVQDAITNFSASPSLTLTSKEVRALDAIGYNIIALGGGGTQNFVAKFDATGTNIINSSLFDTGANVGIGTSSPGRTLHIKSAAPTIRLEDSTLPNSFWELQQSAFVNDTFGFLRYENGSAVADKSFVVSSAGNLGIGTGTPQRKLHIRSAAPVIRLEDSTLPNSFWELQQSAFFVDTFGFLRYENGAAVQSKSFVMSSAGNFGIGTAAPTQKLEVAGNMKVNGVLSVSGPLQITGAGNGVSVESADGIRCRQIGIDNTGSLLAKAVSCGPIPTIPDKFAYQVNLVTGNSFLGSVSIYSIDGNTGVLTRAGSPVSADMQSAAIAIDPSGEFAYVANTGSNDVSMFKINAATGAFSPINTCPACVNTVPAGTSPSLVAIHPSGKFAYVLSSGSNAILVFTIDSTTGILTQTTSIPAGIPDSIAIHPSNGSAYVPDGPSDVINRFAVNPATGNLTPIDSTTVSGFPFGLVLHPSGAFAYALHRSADEVLVFAIDTSTGKLTQTCSTSTGSGSGPNSVVIDPLGKFAYVLYAPNGNPGQNMTAYAINSTTGCLSGGQTSTPVPGRLLDWLTLERSGKFAYLASEPSGLDTSCLNTTTGSTESIWSFGIDRATGLFTNSGNVCTDFGGKVVVTSGPIP